MRATVRGVLHKSYLLLYDKVYECVIEKKHFKQTIINIQNIQNHACKHCKKIQITSESQVFLNLSITVHFNFDYIPVSYTHLTLPTILRV